MATTTDHTVVRDLRASLAVRQGVPCGVTWGDFQAAMRVLGVQDDDRIASIEHGTSQYPTGRLVRDDAPDGVEIREARS